MGLEDVYIAINDRTGAITCEQCKDKCNLGCEEFNCPEGKYLDGCECKPVHYSCKSAPNDKEDSCIECKLPFEFANLPDGRKLCLCPCCSLEQNQVCVDNSKIIYLSGLGCSNLNQNAESSNDLPVDSETNDGTSTTSASNTNQSPNPVDSTATSTNSNSQSSNTGGTAQSSSSSSSSSSSTSSSPVVAQNSNDGSVAPTPPLLDDNAWLASLINKNSLNLIYKASRDGYEPETLYQMCNEHSPAIVLFSMNNSKYGFVVNEWGYGNEPSEFTTFVLNSRNVYKYNGVVSITYEDFLGYKYLYVVIDGDFIRGDPDFSNNLFSYQIYKEHYYVEDHQNWSRESGISTNIESGFIYIGIYDRYDVEVYTGN